MDLAAAAGARHDRPLAGDTETGDGGTVLFDRSVSHYLPGLEVEAAALTVWRLRNILDKDVELGYHQLANF